ncbi:membrane protein, partial [Achromatium sp. WMS1]
AGAGLGGVVSAILGSHEHNHTLDKFRAEISRGRILLMVDTPLNQIDKIQNLIHQHHPEAETKITAHHI